ncbi:MAG: FtsX-like permease family protein, partial [Terriglobales bacterium]
SAPTFPWLVAARTVQGAGAGLLLAETLLATLGAAAAPLLPRAGRLALDWHVFAFTLGLGLLTTLLCGLAPALAAARRQPAEVLQLHARTQSSGGRLRGALVGAEVGLALLLLVGAGLLVRSLLRLEARDQGFQPRDALSFVIGLPEPGYPHRAQQEEFFRQADARLQALPGVSAVGGIYPLPYSAADWEDNFAIVGRPAAAPGLAPATNMANLRGDYFRAMGVRLLRGRAFNQRDTAAAPDVTIVDDTFARRFFGGPDPLAAALGQQLDLDGSHRTIVGVIAHMRSPNLKGTKVETFIPQEQSSINVGALWFVARSNAAATSGLQNAARAAIAAVDLGQPVDDVQTMEQRVALTLAPRRLILELIAAFAILALLLAAIGIYGVLSYAVEQRTRELGIRMALGADAGRIRRQVLAQGLRWSGIGAVCGLLAALAGARLAASFLYGISPRDPLTLIVAPMVVLALAALACYWPARRATRVDPVQALRA